MLGLFHKVSKIHSCYLTNACPQVILFFPAYTSFLSRAGTRIFDTQIQSFPSPTLNRFLALGLPFNPGLAGPALGTGLPNLGSSVSFSLN